MAPIFFQIAKLFASMTPQTHDVRSTRSGFALVVALGLMAFVVLLLLSIASLVRVDTLSSSNQLMIAEAKENAKLGLLVALGDVQSATGVDQRITASAEVLETDVGSVPEHPNWTGVWTSWAWDSANPSSLPDKEAHFQKWLVSVPGGVDSEDRSLAWSMVSEDDWVSLLDRGTLGESAPEEDRVFAGKTSIGDEGHYAYWVADESVKVRFNLTEQDTSYGPLLEQAFDLSAPQRWAIEQVSDSNESGGSSIFANQIDFSDPALERAIFTSTVGILTGSASVQDAYGLRYHDLSLHSMGLMTNARDGGLKKDLSLAFEMNASDFDSHPEFAQGAGGANSLYTTTNPDGKSVKHLWVYESEDLAVPQGHYKGPTWHLLRDYYQMYRELSNPTSAPELRARHALPLPDRNTNNRSISNLYNNGQTIYNTGGSAARPLLRPRTLKVAPVIARVQLILSLTAVPVSGDDIVRPVSLIGNANVYRLRMVLDPIITIYNPYSANLWFQGITVSISQFVESLQWELNGVASNVLSLEEIFTRSGINTAGDFGVISISDVAGITLKPGEVRIYSPGNDTPVPFTKSVDAVEGWPSGGGFYVDSLDPDPEQIEPNWETVDLTDNYYNHELKSGEKQLILGQGSDRIAVEFETTLSDGNVRWMGRGSPGNHRAAEDQMIIEAYLVQAGAYSERFEISSTVRNADVVQHYTTLRADVEFGDSGLMGNIGRLPDANGTYMIGNLAGFKQSLGQVDIRLKTEDDSSRPFPVFGLSSMNAFQTNKQAASSGDYGVLNPPFAVARYPLGDVVQATQFDPDSFRAYWGPTRNFTSQATSFVAGTDLPKAPLLSLGQLQHVDTAIYGYESSHAIGNSFATPWIELDEVEESDRANIDTSYLANDALWDGYFFSSLTPQDTPIYEGVQRDLDTVIQDFVRPDGEPLPNRRFVFMGESVSEFETAIVSGSNTILPDAFTESAGYLGCEGAFNINSTSVEAWKALYASLGDGGFQRFDSGGSLIDGANTDENRISRFSIPMGDAENKWTGYSSLTDAEIDRLAEETVAQVKERGPFLSMAEFVNRRISNDDLGGSGALQAAIDAANVNNASLPINQNEITGYVVNENAMVPSDLGTAGYLTQADLLTMLGSSLSVRGDTFVIRSYGDVKNPTTGEVEARAWCEAVIQRNPDYLDSSADRASVVPTALSSVINQEFGRRYQIVAFRWLSEDEV